MKTNRNYRFVLTVIDDEMLQEGKTQILSDEVCGERMFQSECHYYAEKNIIECIKDAEKGGRLEEYYGHTYLIYKETKPKTVEDTTVDEKTKTKTVVTRELPTTAMLIEKLTVDENGINIE